MSFEHVAFASHFVLCIVGTMESHSLVLGSTSVLLFSCFINEPLLSLFVHVGLFFHLAFLVAHLKFEKQLPEGLVKTETVVSLVGGPFLVVLLSILMPSTRYLHVVQFGCIKFLAALLCLQHPKARSEVLLAASLFFLWGVVPLIAVSTSESSVKTSVVLAVAYLALLTRHSGKRLQWKAFSSIVVVYFYLVVSRAFLPFVEHELKLPLMLHNFLRSFIAFFLFVGLIGVVRAVPTLSLQFGSRLPEDWNRFTLLQLACFAVGQSQLPVIFIGVSVHDFSTPWSLVSVIIATTPVFASIIKSVASRSMDFAQLLVVFFGLLGALLVTLSQLSPLGSIGGITLALTSAVVWAVSGVFHENYLVKIPLLPKAALQSLFGSIFALLCSLLLGESVSLSMFDLHSLVYLAFLSLGFSFLSLLATVYLLSEAGFSQKN